MSPVSDDRAKPGMLLACEKTPQSHSPAGVVKDGEVLARMIFRPPHTDDSGRVDYKFITIGDLQKGCSFDRRDIRGADKIDECGGQRAQDAGREYLGYAEVMAGRVRAIADNDGMRALCVLDDATKDNPAHAIIRIIRQSCGRGEVRQIRGKLMRNMQFPAGC